MARKPTPTPSLSERIEERSIAAQRELSEKSFSERLWGNVHMEAANLTDTYHTVTGNEYVRGAFGAAVGLLKGALIGLLVGAAIVYFPLLWGLTPLFGGLAVTEAAVLSTCIGLGAVGNTIYSAVDYFRDAREHSGDKLGAKAADNIAAHGHAISKSKSPTVVKAVHDARHRLNARPDSDKISTPGVEDKSETHFRDLFRSDKTRLEPQGRER